MIDRGEIFIRITFYYVGAVAYRGGGGRGGHGPRAQALEGAPGQLVGANFKKKIRPRQISKVTSLQWPGLTYLAKVAYAMGPAFPMH